MATTKINFSRSTGRLSRSTANWAKLIKEREDVAGSVLILVDLARDAAALADAARREEDGRLYLAAAARLQQLVDVVERRSGDGDSGSAGGGVDDGGSEDDGADELALVLRSGPTLGDAA